MQPVVVFLIEYYQRMILGVIESTGLMLKKYSTILDPFRLVAEKLI
jgi:hypothetical protein